MCCLLFFGRVCRPEPPEAVEVPVISAPRVAAIAVGGAHVCALSEAGAVTCWGANDGGQLGYAHPWDIGDDEQPTDAGPVDVGGLVVGLTAGDRHTCALLDTNRIRCWGYGDDLALGRGNHDSATIGDDEVPAEMGDGIIYASGAFEALAAGDHHTCMLTANGYVKCWGDSPVGALGYGYATKTGGWLGMVPLGGATAVALAVGCEHTCAILASDSDPDDPDDPDAWAGGRVRCWGQAIALGYGGVDNIGDNDTPANVGDLDLGEPVVQLAAGYRHTCGLTDQGAVRCWGMGGYGALGGGETRSVPLAREAPVVDLGEPVAYIAAGRRHTCAITVSGAVRCWGDGAHGALGYGHTLRIGDDEPVVTAGVVRLGESAIAIDAGDGFSCALLESGRVRCWGDGSRGRLGNASEQDIGDDEVPAAIAPVEAFLP